jgi:hypothetical protein
METREILLSRIWEDLKQANVNGYYALELIDSQTKRGRWYNAAIALLSVGGALQAFINDKYPILTPVFFLAIIIANQLLPHLFYNADYYAKLCRVHTNCYQYEHELHDLYMKYHAADIDDDTAGKQFRQISKNNASMYTETSQIFGRMKKKLESTAMNKSKEYFESVYYQ